MTKQCGENLDYASKTQEKMDSILGKAGKDVGK
jgi:hypothetical protein